MEDWKPVYLCADYEVSNAGRLRRVTPKRGARVGHVLSQHWDADGYRIASLRLPLQKYSKPIRVHRAVAISFLGSPPEGKQVNHKDGNKENNAVENLEWTTPLENLHHATALGLKAKGERNGYSKLTQETVGQIRQLHKIGMRGCDIADLFSLPRTTVCGITKGRAWRHSI